MICALAMHRDASERASERAGKDWRQKSRLLGASLPLSPYCGHACCVPLGAAAFIARPARTALLPPALLGPSHRRSLDYAIAIFGTTEKGREGRVATDGRTEDGCGLPEGLQMFRFFPEGGKVAPAEARRPRPRPGGRHPTLSYGGRAPGGRGRVGRRAHILGAIEGLSFSSKLSSPSRVW